MKARLSDPDLYAAMCEPTSEETAISNMDAFFKAISELRETFHIADVTMNCECRIAPLNEGEEPRVYRSGMTRGNPGRALAMLQAAYTGAVSECIEIAYQSGKDAATKGTAPTEAAPEAGETAKLKGKGERHE